MTDSTQESEAFSRRSVLRTGGTAAGVLAVGGVAASGTVQAGQRGGRALFTGTFKRNAPFTVFNEGEAYLSASCMSGNSAEQRYFEYDVDYCDGGTCTMYVHPDEAPVDDEGEFYEFRSGAKDCKDGSGLQKTSFGPSKKGC